MDQDKHDLIIRALADPDEYPSDLAGQQRWSFRRLRARLFTSVGRVEEARHKRHAAATPLGLRTDKGITAQRVQFSDRTLLVFDDGSFRNVPRRRRFGISGRQLRMARKDARRRYYHSQRVEAAAAQPAAD